MVGWSGWGIYFFYPDHPTILLFLYERSHFISLEEIRQRELLQVLQLDREIDPLRKQFHKWESLSCLSLNHGVTVLSTAGLASGGTTISTGCAASVKSVGGCTGYCGTATSCGIASGIFCGVLTLLGCWVGVTACKATRLEKDLAKPQERHSLLKEQLSVPPANLQLKED